MKFLVLCYMVLLLHFMFHLSHLYDTLHMYLFHLHT